MSVFLPKTPKKTDPPGFWNIQQAESCGIFDENGVQKFIILPDVKYVTTKPNGESLAPYAKTHIDINDNEPQFQNYFLNNNIAKDNDEKSLLDMIAERLERHIYQIIKTDEEHRN